MGLSDARFAGLPERHQPRGETPSHALTHTVIPPKVWQACPICHGVGSMPAGFYTAPEGGYVASTNRELCRSCHGRGIV